MAQEGARSSAAPAWKRKLYRAVLSLAGSVLFLFAAGEILLRTAIRFDLASFRNPANYAHPFCDDDYHKLRFYWQRAKDLRPGEYVQDPYLGWVPDVPGGLRSRADGSRRPQVALFGDSYAAGVPPARPDERIALLLEDQFSEGQVVDYAVAGYGVDQIFLRFQQTMSGVHPPDVAIIGILLDDVDRVIERFRAGPKPFFEIAGGELVLRGTPIQKTPEEWLEDNPVGRWSFFLALIARRLDEWAEGKGAYESGCRREEKEALNRKIIETLAEEGRSRDVETLFLLFYAEQNLRTKSWREDFLKNVFADIDADYVDTKPILLSSAARDGIDVSEYYFPLPNGHLNGKGNTTVAEALYDRLTRLYGWGKARERRWKGTIEFGAKGQTAIDYQASGLEYDGEHFSWTSSTRATIRLPAPPEPKDLVFYLETICAVRRPDDERSLRILFEETVILDYELRRLPDCWASYTIELAVDGDLIEGEDITVTLELPYLLTPKEGGFEIEDSRRLGIALKSLTLREAG